MIRLSVLDQSPIRKGGTAGQAVAETLELAVLCDRLGYHRYWLAEHHNTPSLAGSSPEILVARIAGLTNRLRVGSGGIMLTHYSPLKVAESFRMLEALYPGRIDLGIGRAPGADRRTAEALSAGPGALGIEHYPYQLGNLLKYIANADDAQTNGVQAQPVGSATPQLWMLGSSDASAAFAAHFGLPFSYAHFINADGGERVMSAYRTSFNPSPHAAVPSGSVGVFAICADTDEEARFEAASRDLYSLKQRTGEPIAIPAPSPLSPHEMPPPKCAYACLTLYAGPSSLNGSEALPMMTAMMSP